MVCTIVEHPSEILSVHRFEDFQRSVVIEDDGRVCYAYVLDNDESIVGDVWLYNRCHSPETPEWSSPDNAPFANAREFADELVSTLLPKQESDFSVRLAAPAKNGVLFEILIGTEVFAVLGDGTKPGWTRLAKKDGPLALKLS